VLTTTTRTVSTRDRLVNRTDLTAVQARALAAQNGAAQRMTAKPGATGGNPSTTIDGDVVNVTATSSSAVSLPAVTGETRQLHILTAPGDISFKLAGIKSKLYWDFAYNVGGRERFNDIYQLGRSFGIAGGSAPYNPRDSIAWLVGFQLGETKKKGDWQAYLNYRETGIASVDPNLNDSDFALGELNMRGFKLSLAYQLADAVVFNVTGMTAWNMDKNLSGGRATNAPAIAQDNAVNVVLVDLNIKF
jgi:hypothetical protein